MVSVWQWLTHSQVSLSIWDGVEDDSVENAIHESQCEIDDYGYYDELEVLNLGGSVIPRGLKVLESIFKREDHKLKTMPYEGPSLCQV